MAVDGQYSDSAHADNPKDQKPLLTAKVIRDLLDYNPITGEAFWKPRDLSYCDSVRTQKRFNTIHAGKPAFTFVNVGGYCQSTILGHRVLAHRAAWLWMTGDWPDGRIDHIDRNPANNAWANLRLATNSQNQANRASYKSSSSRYLGVTRQGYSWVARITKAYKPTYLGSFKSEAEAARAYDKAAKEIHGDFANLNFPDSASNPPKCDNAKPSPMCKALMAAAARRYGGAE